MWRRSMEFIPRIEFCVCSQSQFLMWFKPALQELYSLAPSGIGTTVAKTALASWLLPEEKARIPVEPRNSAVLKTEPTLGCVNKQAGLVLVHGANVPLFVVVLPRFPSLSFFLPSARFFFSLAGFQLLPLFRRYLGIVTGGNQCLFLF